MQLVLHAPFGARINRAWGLALRKRFCRHLQLRAAGRGHRRRHRDLARDRSTRSRCEIVFRFLHPRRTVEDVLAQALLDAPMFTARWRWNATRALAVLRFWAGARCRRRSSACARTTCWPRSFPTRSPAGEPRRRSQIPDHPLVNETIHDCLHEAMDLDGAPRSCSARSARGECGSSRVDTPEPSPFSHEILNAKPVRLPGRRAARGAPGARRGDAADAARGSPPAWPGSTARPSREVAAEAWPDVRDADELHDALLELGLLPEELGEGAGWAPLLDGLVAAHRASRLRAGGRTFWIAAERVRLALAAPIGDAGARFLDPPLAPLAAERAAPGPDEVAVRIVRGWVPRLGPLTAESLARRIGLATDGVVQALLALEGDGLVLRGRFLEDVPWSAEAPHFCERTLLSRIHRLTVGRLRKEIEPVSTADLIRFLLRWQHLVPGDAAARRPRAGRARRSAAGLPRRGLCLGVRPARRTARRLPAGAARRALPLRRGRLGSPLGDGARSERRAWGGRRLGPASWTTPPAAGRRRAPPP